MNIDIVQKFTWRTLPLVLSVAFALSTGLPTQAQSTTVVRPRQYPLLTGQLLTNGQALTNNSALPGQTVGVWTNTLIPFSGAHAIGLTAYIVNSNAFVAASNLTVTVYPAYDVGGGNANGIGLAWGTNFSSTPLLTWTISYKSNSLQSTNLPAALWEPATSLGYTVSNGTSSNITLTLIQSVAP
jgi:hypothetical protein